MLWMFLGCIGKNGDSAKEQTWLDLTKWHMLDAVEDPLFDHRPTEVDCPPSALQVELGQLEIQTGTCNYAALAFQTQYDLPEDTFLEALVLHTGLWALEDTQAHFALLIDGEMFWEEFPPIPSDTEFFFHEATWSNAIPKETTIVFHLHNHGANDWKFGYFQEGE